jgi:hypothetical protein
VDCIGVWVDEEKKRTEWFSFGKMARFKGFISPQSPFSDDHAAKPPTPEVNLPVPTPRCVSLI